MHFHWSDPVCVYLNLALACVYTSEVYTTCMRAYTSACSSPIPSKINPGSAQATPRDPPTRPPEPGTPSTASASTTSLRSPEPPTAAPSPQPSAAPFTAVPAAPRKLDVQPTILEPSVDSGSAFDSRHEGGRADPGAAGAHRSVYLEEAWRSVEGASTPTTSTRGSLELPAVREADAALNMSRQSGH